MITLYRIRSKAVSAPKEYNLHCNYETLRKNNFAVLKGKLGEDTISKLKYELQRHRNIFTVATETKQRLKQVLL